MSITATELKNNLSHYLALSATEDIYITKNGKVISKLTSPITDKMETLKSLAGIIASDNEDIDIREERLSKK